eukprot:CAMPEP_0169273370 /NCGR_PEP_ID=MMETSP1016-20121227/51064_1 /TAXON_ID=342587 /ORGANISM="Karlodinium micrum, Strain CCMP2283" /LENGTH=101 /DNA_ID=CAMNT_0009359677 /DNA_START=75 /DNA_END=381 /DNA_ORIENTATION=-
MTSTKLGTLNFPEPNGEFPKFADPMDPPPEPVEPIEPKDAGPPKLGDPSNPPPPKLGPPKLPEPKRLEVGPDRLPGKLAEPKVADPNGATEPPPACKACLA